MQVAFTDGDLADLCASRAALERRWKSDWALVGRRLCEIAASPTLAAVEQLPHTTVTPLTGGEFDVAFSEGITLRLHVDGAGRGRTRRALHEVHSITVTAVTVNITAGTTA